MNDKHFFFFFGPTGKQRILLIKHIVFPLSAQKASKKRAAGAPRGPASPPLIKGALASLYPPLHRGTSGSPKIKVEGGKGGHSRWQAASPYGHPLSSRGSVTVGIEQSHSKAAGQRGRVWVLASFPCPSFPFPQFPGL